MAACFEYYADLAEKLDQRQWAPIDVPMAEFKSAVRREPLGVIGLICPWNYPLLMSTVSADEAWDRLPELHVSCMHDSLPWLPLTLGESAGPL